MKPRPVTASPRPVAGRFRVFRALAVPPSETNLLTSPGPTATCSSGFLAGPTDQGRERSAARGPSKHHRRGQPLRHHDAVDDRLTYAQAADVLGCHVSNVAKLVAKGRIPLHVEPGARRGYLLREEVESLAEARRVAAVARKGRVHRRPLVDRRPDAEHDWLTPSEVGRLIGMTQQGVLARARRGALPATRNGGRWWIRRDHLEQVEAARLVGRTRRP